MKYENPIDAWNARMWGLEEKLKRAEQNLAVAITLCEVGAVTGKTLAVRSACENLAASIKKLTGELRDG